MSVNHVGDKKFLEIEQDVLNFIIVLGSKRTANLQPIIRLSK